MTEHTPPTAEETPRGCLFVLLIWLVVMPFAYDYEKHEIIRSRGTMWTTGDRVFCCGMSAFWPVSLPVVWLTTHDWDAPASW